MTNRDAMAAGIAAAFREARRVGASIDDAADVVAAHIRATIDQASMDDVAPADVVLIQSILSHSSGEPLVQCKTNVFGWQWTPELARQHALGLLEVAEAAIHDAAQYRWLTLKQDIPRDRALAAILDLRRFRGDVEREDWR